MQNKIKTFMSFDCSVREARAIFRGHEEREQIPVSEDSDVSLTRRFDARKVPARNKELQKITEDGLTLQQKLEMLKKLERQKRTKKSAEQILLLKESIEEKEKITIPDGMMEEMIHELIEKHDKEVGTAIRIKDVGFFSNGEDQFMLVHASETATKLVLSHHSIGKLEKVDPRTIKRIFEKAGFEVDTNIYKEEEIPAARPFSEVVKDGWEIKLPAKETQGNIVPKPEKKIVPIPVAVESLIDGAAFTQHKDLLDQVFGQEESIKESDLREVKITSWGQFLREFKKAGRKTENINTVLRRGKNVTEKVKKSLRGRGNADIKIGDVITFSTPVKKASKSIVHEFFRNPTEANRRKFSSLEFTKKVETSKLSKADKTALIEAAIKLDVTVRGREVRKSGSDRGPFLERQAAKTANGKRKIQELFKKEVGTEKLDLTNFYKPTVEKSKENKDKIKDILSGESTVFMLRIDRMKAGGFDSRVERTRGAAWLDDLDAPQNLRKANDYTYKYSEIVNLAEKQQILEKYLGEKPAPGREDEYKIAQVEIPNCENPAIVIKKIEKPVAVVPKVETKRIGTTAAQYFRNVPGGWTLIFRIPDWFTSEQERNYLADPAILDLGGETIRESEYLNARARLDPEPHAFTEKRVNKILGLMYGAKEASESEHGANIEGDRGVIESLEEYLDMKSKVDKTKKNKETILAMVEDLRKTLDKVGRGKGFNHFQKLLKAKAEWKEKWYGNDEVDENRSDGLGADLRMIEFAEMLYDSQMEDFDVLLERMRKEDDAHYLAHVLKNNRGELEGKSVLDLDDDYLNAIVKKYGMDPAAPAKEAIEGVLYDEDKLNAARPPVFIGDAAFLPPTIDSQGREKIIVWKNQSSFSKEVLNVHSPASLMIQVASHAIGFITYTKFGIGLGDEEALDKYLEQADGSEESKKEFRKLFRNQKAFEAFRDFVLKGQVPEKGGNKISIPLDEISLLLPGFRLLVMFLDKCVTSVGVTAGPPTTDPGTGPVFN